MIALERGPFGSYLLRNLSAGDDVPADDPRASVLVQVDYDFCGIAADFGWSVRSVNPPDVRPVSRGPADAACDMTRGPGWIMPRADAVRAGVLCEHAGTDGTIECACGLTATDFIDAAREYLDSHIGATADDPGYFGND